MSDLFPSGWWIFPTIGYTIISLCLVGLGYLIGIFL
jgi:hypothetical protein